MERCEICTDHEYSSDEERLFIVRVAGKKMDLQHSYCCSSQMQSPFLAKGA